MAEEITANRSTAIDVERERASKSVPKDPRFENYQRVILFVGDTESNHHVVLIRANDLQ